MAVLNGIRCGLYFRSKEAEIFVLISASFLLGKYLSFVGKNVYLQRYMIEIN